MSTMKFVLEFVYKLLELARLALELCEAITPYIA